MAEKKKVKVKIIVEPAPNERELLRKIYAILMRAGERQRKEEVMLYIVTDTQGRKSQVCEKCIGKTERADGLADPNQPNRQDYETREDYENAVKLAFGCARCDRPIDRRART